MTLIAHPVISDRLGNGRLAIEQLVECKADTVVSAYVPARDEAAIVAGVVEIAAALRAVGLIDEIIVIDDGSSDATTARASAAGRECCRTPRARAKAKHFDSRSQPREVTCWCSSTPTLPTTRRRPSRDSSHRCCSTRACNSSRPRTGARSTGERAKAAASQNCSPGPLLERFHPELAQIAQPLAGATAMRRAALNHLTPAAGYGIEIALLIDVYLAHGIDAIAEVDLGERIHLNRPITQLRPHAHDILDAVLARTPPVTNLLGELP